MPAPDGVEPRAHPRSRGEHAAIPCMDWNVSGSSPLARGTLFSFCCGAAAPGLIPARAGNTVDIAAVHKPSRAHPRSRGEHSTSSAVLVSRLGSSPLARGTRWVTSWITDPCGLIPARAGNTGGGGGGGLGWGAHPRSRGEHVTTQPRGTVSPGSSPLARGTPFGVDVTPLRDGLIPARAGNTGTDYVTSVKDRAHPRSRGEHGIARSSCAICKGSSPLARGTPCTGPAASSLSGLIPARAGNTHSVSQVYKMTWAHPRSRGEHSRTFFPTYPTGGSSPLARGTLGFHSPRPSAGGLIPARAGNTMRVPAELAQAGAHPRSRGEHWVVVPGR